MLKGLLSNNCVKQPFTMVGSYIILTGLFIRFLKTNMIEILVSFYKTSEINLDD